MNKFFCIILVILLVGTSSCNLLLPLPTPPPPTPDGRTVTGLGQSDSAGEILFQDAPHAWDLTITLEDDQTGEPVQGIEAWFASNGAEVLIFMHDPSGSYPDTIRELPYAGLSSHSTASGKEAAPSPRVTAAAALSLVKLVDVYKSFGTWMTFLAGFPNIEKWGQKAEQLCVTPEQARAGLGLGSEVLPAFVSRDAFGDAEVQMALIEVYDAGKEQAAGNLLNGYAGAQNPSTLRLTVFSMQAGFPPFLRIDGFCR